MLNPDTLEEEGDRERSERQARTGVFGNGLIVDCRPDPADPTIVQAQDRAACLNQPYAGCQACPHRLFTLVFAVKSERHRVVSCPKWDGPGDRCAGRMPVGYKPVEAATCASRPFEFCPSCPGPGELHKLGIDKGKEGWYGRWERFRREEYSSDP